MHVSVVVYKYIYIYSYIQYIDIHHQWAFKSLRMLNKVRGERLEFQSTRAVHAIGCGVM